MTYSFDIFDTCLCRLCGEPRQLFDVLSLKVQSLMGDNASEHMRQMFVSTRATCGGRNLHEIYEHVAEKFPLPYSIEEMVNLELDTEREMLSPIEATRLLVEEKRQQGGHILFISDMYLPDYFLRERLEYFGFYNEGDILYVNESVGANKYDGSLFRLIHEREGIPFRQWHHYGDNRHSDYTVPRKLGIHAHHLHYDYLHYERQWQYQPNVGFQYQRIIAGIARATRLQSKAHPSLQAYVSNITAPFTVFWILNVMQDATRRGIRRLYFLARDVHSEYIIARQLSSIFPSIEVRYLFISSRALYSSPLAAQYLLQEGFGEDIPMAVVDSCTSGKTLDTINNILQQDRSASAVQAKIFGYFIACIHRDAYQCNIDNCNYIFDSKYLSTMTTARISRLNGMRFLFELLISFNYHHTIVGFEYHGNKLRPVSGEDNADQWHFKNNEEKYIKRSNDQILSAFTNAVLKTGVWQWASIAQTQISMPTLIDFIDHPRREYVDFFHTMYWWGKPYIGAIMGRHRGVWKRGCRAFSYPRWLVNLIYRTLDDPTRRAKLNRIASYLRFVIKRK